MNILNKLLVVGILSSLAIVPVFAAASGNGNGTATPDFPTPPWEIYCQFQLAKNIPCNFQTWYAKVGFVLPGTSTTNPVGTHTAQPWGQTAAAITAAFPAHIATNFANNANLNAQLTNITPVLSRLSTELLALDRSGYTAEILKSAAQKASAANLRVLQSAFGNTLMAAAMPYAPAAIIAQYNALPVLAPLPLSANYYELKGTVSPFTGSQSYIIDVLAETYTLGSDSMAVALQKTSLYTATVTGAGPLNVLYLTAKGSAPASVQAALGMQPAEGPGPAWGWATVIMTIVGFFDPTAGADLLKAVEDIPSDISGAWNTVTNNQVIGPDGAIGGGYPPDFPDYPGPGNDYLDCADDPTVCQF